MKQLIIVDNDIFMLLIFNFFFIFYFHVFKFIIERVVVRTHSKGHRPHQYYSRKS